MVSEEMITKLKKCVGDISNNAPLLLIGGAVVWFKNRYKGLIYTLRDTNQVRDFVSEFSGKDVPGPIIVEDISMISDNAAFMLLKLVEEAKYPIILLSYFDRVNPILLSRIKQIVKLPTSDQIVCKFLPPDEALKYIENYLQENTAIDDRERLVAETSPQLYQLERKIGSRRNKDKIAFLMS